MSDEIRSQFPKLYFIETEKQTLDLKQEVESGFIEYKRTLLNASRQRLLKYATQMQYRIGNNKANFAIYYIGIDDDGSLEGISSNKLVSSIQLFHSIAQFIKASVTSCELITVENKQILKFKVTRKSKSPISESSLL
jgi:GTPase